MARSGTIVWCATCGCFAKTRANGLSGWCNGPPQKSQGSSGRRSQLNRLNANLHPVTCTAIPPAKRIDDNGLAGSGGYQRLMLRRDSVDEHFSPYVPTILPLAKAAENANSAMEKRDMLRARIRAKQLRCKKLVKKAKRDRRDAEVHELIHSFLNDESGSDEVVHCDVCVNDVEI